jgi:D-glycero-D-manno-heptose 1,7-bisphosphate phosphatase
VDPVVFLDRDNTLIANDGDLGDPAAVRLLPGVAAGLLRLKSSGFRIVVVTNQGGVARGNYGENDVERVHRRVAELVDAASGGERVIDRFYYCPYHPDGTVPEYRREHPWRKPQPGMLLQATEDLRLDLDRGWMVGDQPRDVLAGRAAGCRTVLVATRPQDGEGGGDFHAASFAAAVELILTHRQPEAAEAARRRERRAKAIFETKPPTERAVTATLPRRKKRRPNRPEVAGFEPLRRALADLLEEFRIERARRNEFGAFRIAAIAAQVATLTLGTLSLLEVSDPLASARWLGGALLTQGLVVALLLFDGR